MANTDDLKPLRLLEKAYAELADAVSFMDLFDEPDTIKRSSDKQELLLDIEQYLQLNLPD